MLRHTVLYSFKKNADKKVIIDLLHELTTLKSHIKGISFFYVGEIFGTNIPAAKFEYVINVDFVSDEAFDEYRVHPAHLSIKERMKPLLIDHDALFMFDFRVKKNFDL